MNTERPRKVPVFIQIIDIVRLFIACAARCLFSLYWGTEGEKLPPITDSILKVPAVVVAEKIRNQEITSVEVLEICIKRIKDTKSALNCVIADRFEEAYKEARAADALIRSGTRTVQQLEEEKPFLGVPFSTKESISVKGLPHTAGVVNRKGITSTEDADVIRLLRDKGAIIMAITNVPELCMWWESHNHIYGRTNNPYNTTRIVGGSSGGEGCLQASAGSIFGIGSDIGGSIRMPAYFNGIFGHKPSKETVSNAGQFPNTATDIQKELLAVGPMTRFAADLKPLLKIISGENAINLNLDKPTDIKKIKLFYQFGNNAPLVDSVDPEIIKAMKKVVEYFNKQHNIKGEEKHIGLLASTAKIWFANMKSGDSFSKQAIGKENLLGIIWEMFKNFIGCSGHTLIILFTALTDRKGLKLEGRTYKYFLEKRIELQKIFQDMLGEDGVFLYPTHPTTAPYHNEPLLRPLNFTYTCAINILGMPSTTVPLGLSREGLPLGLQVVANFNNDRLCLAVAEELDKAFGGWVEPHKA